MLGIQGTWQGLAVLEGSMRTRGDDDKGVDGGTWNHWGTWKEQGQEDTWVEQGSHVMGKQGHEEVNRTQGTVAWEQWRSREHGRECGVG